MFRLFKKKSPTASLENKYKKLLEASFKLSTSNRKESDKKRAEAERVLEEIEKITLI